MARRLLPALAWALLPAAPFIFAVGSGAPEPQRAPVVVELYTSEGCSSCPPADALLSELERTQPVPGALIIPLEEHVDYWNHDGWRDPFSSEEITARQTLYARRLGVSGPYTPQMVVAGRTDVVGSASRDAIAAIAAAAQAPRAEMILSVSVAGSPPHDSLRATMSSNPVPGDAPEPADIVLVIAEDGLASNVSAGENSGRHLEHRAVLRRLIRAGHIDPGQSFFTIKETPIASGWKRENLRAVVFLEGTASGKIFGAATASVGH